MTASATRESATKEKAAKKQKPTSCPDKETAAKKPQTKAHRDAKGRFVKGNPGGHGNPFAHLVAKIRWRSICAVPLEKVELVMRKLTEMALGGDLAAMKLFLLYMIGKPAEPVDPDWLAVDEWRKLKAAAVDPAEPMEALQKWPVTLASKRLIERWPGQLEYNDRQAKAEYAELEAQVAEDERYMEELEKAEEEALRLRMETLRQKEGFNPRPACDPSSEYLQAAAMGAGVRSPNGAACSNEAPSSNGQTADEKAGQSPECKSRPARPVDDAARSGSGPSSIGSFGMENRFGWPDWAALMARVDKAARDKALSHPPDCRRPSSNGEKTAADEHG
jgi:hypothetical protein